MFCFSQFLFILVEDYDTDDNLLRVHVTQDPVHGRILMDESSGVREFTMSDLNENRITYAHDGTETVADSFSFTVTDGTHDDFYVFPNTVFTTTEPQRMDIEIVPVDNGLPQMLINRGAPSISNLPNGKRGFRITKKTLRADDRDSNVTMLNYVITASPLHGKLVNSENGSSSIQSFTQGNEQEILLVLLCQENFLFCCCLSSSLKRLETNAIDIGFISSKTRLHFKLKKSQIEVRFGFVAF